MFEFLEAADGDDTAPSAVLDGLCERWPARARELREAVGRLAHSGLAAPLEEREQIGPYRLGRRLGLGGMGIVHLAWRESADTPVAIKLLRADQLGEPGARERFEREVSAASQLDHPGIVRLVDRGTQPAAGSGVGAQERPYVVFEYHPGGTLDRVVRATAAEDPSALTGADLLGAIDVPADALTLPGPLRGAWWEVVVRITLEVARALAHAHARGVIHRDVKPSNILVTPEGRVLLLDFGLASVRGASRLTASGVQLGSLPYMSPEQVRGETSLDRRTDIYSLGVTLYELLTLQLPFRGANVEQLGLAITKGDVPSPSRVAPGHSGDALAALDAVIGCAMDPEPQHRYKSCDAFAADLTALLHGRSVAARPPTALQRSTRWIRRRPFVASTVVLAGVLAIGMPLGYGLLASRHSAAMERSLDGTLRHLAQLIDTVDANASALAQGPLQGDPRFLEMRLATVNRGLQVLTDAERDGAEFLARDETGSVALRERLSRSRARLLRSRADVHYDLYDCEPAVASYTDQETILRDLLERHPDDPLLHEELGGSLAHRARALTRLERTDEALSPGREAVRWIARAQAAGLHPTRTGGDLAAACLLLASAADRTGHSEEGQDALDRAEALLVDILDGPAATWRERARLGEVYLIRARALGSLRDPDAYLELLRSARFELATALEGAPQHGLPRVHCAEVDMDIALVLAQRTEVEESREHAASAREMITHLLRDQPDNPNYASLVLQVRAIESYVSMRAGELHAGLLQMREAVDAARRRLEPDATDSAARANLVMTLSNLANQLMLADPLGPHRLVESEALTTEAIGMAQTLPEDGMSAVTRSVAFTVRYTRAVSRAKRGDIDGASDDLLELESVAREKHPVDLRFLADAHNEQLLALLAAGAPADESDAERAATLEVLERAVAAGYRDLDELSSTPALEPLRGDPRFESVLDGLR